MKFGKVLDALKLYRPIKRTLRAMVLKTGTYLDLIEQRNDPRYQQARILSNVLLGNAVFEGENFVGQDVEFHGNVLIGYKSTIGHHSILFGGDIEIGKYCQLGPYVSMYAKNHPSEYISSYVGRRLFNGELQTHNIDEPIRIGNDVWIGHGAIILKGVYVGNGAIVGAGSVVTKKIPDYAIVVGNPAQIMRMRFDDEIVELLNQLAWWDRTSQQIDQMKDLFFTNIRDHRAVFIETLKTYLAQ
jgi:virginiamycin A acetyltransferase